MTVLFGYDGSDPAKRAIAAGARLLGVADTSAIVLSVWAPLILEAPLAPAGDAAVVDARTTLDAHQLAEHGALLAADVGYQAHARAVAATDGIAATILAVADELDVAVVVLGNRGLSGERTGLGGVAGHVARHSLRPVLIVPIAS